MPFSHDYSDENAQILFWKYHEDDYFNDEELIEPENLERVQLFHPKKRLEYLMIRKMLKMAFPEHKILYKTIGQPYLLPKDAHISITHSFPFASLAISKNRVGIDLEKIMPKILKIKHKFLYSTETEWTANQQEVDFLTIIWVIKEALYKLHPSKYWSLSKHYEVKKFDISNLEKIECRVFNDEFQDCYTAKVEKIENYYFAIIEETHAIAYQIESKE